MKTDWILARKMSIIFDTDTDPVVKWLEYCTIITTADTVIPTIRTIYQVNIKGHINSWLQVFTAVAVYWLTHGHSPTEIIFQVIKSQFCAKPCFSLGSQSHSWKYTNRWLAIVFDSTFRAILPNPNPESSGISLCICHCEQHLSHYSYASD